jgi:CheY-like chemotaxis protein
VASPEWELDGLRVLIVDDNATARLMVSSQVARCGMLPVVADSADAALRYLGGGEHVDVAILDYQMPDTDGLALARAMRRLPQAQTLPIILLSSLTPPHADEIAALDLAAVVNKPVRAERLYAVIAGALRYVTRPEPGTVTATAATTRTSFQALRILVAEDNPVNQMVIRMMLRKLGCEATVVDNGALALEAIAATVYDVVLLDLHMPEVGGLEVARRLNQEAPHGRPRLIALTASAMEGDREMCLAGGMDDYLSKPIQAAPLTEALERCARHADVLARPAGVAGAP